MISAISGLACLAVLAVAFLAPPGDRAMLVRSAIAFVLNSAWSAWAYLPLSPSQILFDAFRTPIDPMGLLAVGDCIAGYFILTEMKGHLMFWGWALGITFGVQIFVHIAIHFAALSYPDGAWVLIGMFGVQVACFICAGGDGLRDAANRLWRTFSDRGHHRDIRGCACDSCHQQTPDATIGRL